MRPHCEALYCAKQARARKPRDDDGREFQQQTFLIHGHLQLEVTMSVLQSKPIRWRVWQEVTDVTRRGCLPFVLFRKSDFSARRPWIACTTHLYRRSCTRSWWACPWCSWAAWAGWSPVGSSWVTGRIPAGRRRASTGTWSSRPTSRTARRRARRPVWRLDGSRRAACRCPPPSWRPVSVSLPPEEKGKSKQASYTRRYPRATQSLWIPNRGTPGPGSSKPE